MSDFIEKGAYISPGVAAEIVDLNEDDAGLLIQAISRFMKDGIEPDLSSNDRLRALWGQIRKDTREYYAGFTDGDEDS